MKLLKRNSESGQALIMALILLALGSLLIVPMLNLSSMSLKYHDMIQQETLQAFSADSGINYGLCEVYNNPQEYQSTPLDYSYNLNNTTVHVTAQYVPSMSAYKITSTATGANNRRVSLESYVIIDIGLFGNAFACDGNLSITDTTLSAEEGGTCDVYANGNISLTRTTVNGDVTAAGTVSKSQSTVTGIITQHAQVLDFPPIDPTPHIQAAQAGGTSSSISWSGAGSKTLGPKYINGNLKVNSTNVELQGTVYVTGSVEIDGSSHFTGFGDIVAAGTIKMTDSTFDTTNPDTLPLVMSLNSGINLTRVTGTPGMEAVLYAPNGMINLTDSKVYGAVAAVSISVTRGQIFYPTSLKGRPDLPGAGLNTITYGYK